MNNTEHCEDIGDDLVLNKNVYIAYTDISAAGSRALLGIDMRIEYHTLPVPEVDLAEFKPACNRNHRPEPTEQHFQPLQILNHKYEEFSLIIINTILPGDKCHYVVNSILNMCNKSRIHRMVVLSVMRLDVPDYMIGTMFENTFCIANKLTHLDSLQEDILISDAFINILLQLTQIEAYPTHVLVVPGFRGCTGQASDYDASKQNIRLFQDIITEYTGLKFNNALSNSLVFKDENDPNFAAMIYV